MNSDTQAMAQALDLAPPGRAWRRTPTRGSAASSPTPTARSSASGHTQQAGGPHAEIMACATPPRAATSVAAPPPTSRSSPARTTAAPAPAATRWSPPASRKVVASIADPNPLVAGQGFARLRAAGVEVEVGPGADAVARAEHRLFQPHGAQDALGAHEDRGLAGRQDRAGQRRQPVDHLAKPRAPTATPGAPAPAPCSPASAPCCEDDPRLDVRLVETPRQPHAGGRRQPAGDAARRQAVHAAAGRVLHLHGRRDDGARQAALRSARRHRHRCLPGAGRQGRPGRHAARPGARARSTSCMSRPATSSMARWCAKAWSTNSWSTWRPSCSARAAAWPQLRRRWPTLAQARRRCEFTSIAAGRPRPADRSPGFAGRDSF